MGIISWIMHLSYRDDQWWWSGSDAKKVFSKRCKTWFFGVFVPFAFVKISTKLVSSRIFTTKMLGKWWRIWRACFFFRDTWLENCAGVRETVFFGEWKTRSGGNFKLHVLCSPRSLWRWSNLTFAYFPNGLVASTTKLDNSPLENMFRGEFHIAGTFIHCVKVWDPKVYQEARKPFLHQHGGFCCFFPVWPKLIHFSGFEYVYHPPAKGCC